MTAATLAERIRMLRASKGWTQYAAAAACQMSQATYAKLESGASQNPGMDVLRRLSAGFGISADFFTGFGLLHSGENHDAARPEHTVEVPIRAVASGGPPVQAEDLQGETYQLLRHLYRDGRYVIRIHGDSMYPHFWSGDLLLVEPASKVKDGTVVVVKVNGESMVKRLFKRRKGGFIFKGDNPMFPPIEADAEEVEVVGKVLKIVDGERP